MEILLSLLGTRELPVEVTEKVFELLHNTNSELKVTLIVSPKEYVTPADGDADSAKPLNMKCKVVHVERVASNV